MNKGEGGESGGCEPLEWEGWEVILEKSARFRAWQILSAMVKGLSEEVL